MPKPYALLILFWSRQQSYAFRLAFVAHAAAVTESILVPTQKIFGKRFGLIGPEAPILWLRSADNEDGVHKLPSDIMTTLIEERFDMRR